MNGNYLYPSKDPMRVLEQELRICNFSLKTIKTYLYYNKELLRFATKSPREITRQDIKDYLEFLMDSGKSASTINLAINALKFYYQSILRRGFFKSDLAVKRPKKAKTLPVVLSKEEIKEMIGKSENTKHKLVVQVLYCSGLRVSELRNLKIDDIDFGRKCINVKAGKGKKDRTTIISQTVLENINKYLLEYKPIVYLFESYHGGGKMSVRSLQKAVSQAAARAGIKKGVSAHTLRHSFATHLVENNVNLRYVQSLLGHKRLATTQIYTRVATDRFGEINDLL